MWTLTKGRQRFLSLSITLQKSRKVDIDKSNAFSFIRVIILKTISAIMRTEFEMLFTRELNIEKKSRERQ